MIVIINSTLTMVWGFDPRFQEIGEILNQFSLVQDTMTECIESLFTANLVVDMQNFPSKKSICVLVDSKAHLDGNSCDSEDSSVGRSRPNYLSHLH